MGIKTELLMLMSGDGRSVGVCSQSLVRVRGQPPLPLKWGSDSGVLSAVDTDSASLPARHPPSLATTTTTANGCVAFILPTADGDVGAKTNSLLVLQNFCQDNKIKF